MVVKNKRVENYLERSEITLINIKGHQGIKETIKPYGLTGKFLDSGTALQDNVTELYRQLLEKREEQQSLQNEIFSKFKAIKKENAIILILVKNRLIAQPNLIKELGLNVNRNRTIDGFSRQARKFYTTVIARPAILEKLADIGINKEALQLKLKAVEELIADLNKYKLIKGECQRLTGERNKTLSELKRFMDTLKRTLYLVYPPGDRKVLELAGIFAGASPKRK